MGHPAGHLYKQDMDIYKIALFLVFLFENASSKHLKEHKKVKHHKKSHHEPVETSKIHDKWESLKSATSAKMSALPHQFSNLTDTFSAKLTETSDKLTSEKIIPMSGWSLSEKFSSSIINGIIDCTTKKIDEVSNLPNKIESQIDDLQKTIIDIKNDESLQSCFKHRNSTSCKELGHALGNKVADRAEGIVVNVQVEGNKCFLQKDKDACMGLLYKFGHFGFNTVRCGFGSASACFTVIDYVANDQQESGEKKVTSFKKMAKYQLEQAVVLEEVLKAQFRGKDHDFEDLRKERI